MPRTMAIVVFLLLAATLAASVDNVPSPSPTSQSFAPTESPKSSASASASTPSSSTANSPSSSPANSPSPSSSPATSPSTSSSPATSPSPAPAAKATAASSVNNHARASAVDPEMPDDPEEDDLVPVWEGPTTEVDMELFGAPGPSVDPEADFVADEAEDPGYRRKLMGLDEAVPAF